MYKDDFNKEYDSYLALRLTIEHISTMFSGLRDELRRHEEGTKEYEVYSFLIGVHILSYVTLVSLMSP